MAKKSDATMTAEEEAQMTALAEQGAEFAGVTPDDSEPNEDAIADFDLDSDVKVTPVAVQGKYTGSITNAKVDLKSAQILIDITLADNGGVLSDGETPCDGYVYTHRVFLPKPADKDTMTAKGKETKWQWKVNNMGRFFSNIGVNLPRLRDIMEACENGDLVGIDVTVELTVEEYNGELKNGAKSVSLR